MASLTIPITIEQIRELARQLSPQERQALLDSLLAERFDAVLSESDRNRAGRPALSEEEIQAEVDAVRGQRREDRRRAAAH
ncbi:MAG: hypothetical protein AMXMBFR47_25120 [Planctomycetota bacterium]